MFKNKNGASQTVNLNPRIGKGFVIGVIIAILALIILRHCFYTQDIGEAIVQKNWDGKILGSTSEPGLHLKAPMTAVLPTVLMSLSMISPVPLPILTSRLYTLWILPLPSSSMLTMALRPTTPSLISPMMFVP